MKKIDLIGAAIDICAGSVGAADTPGIVFSSYRDTPAINSRQNFTTNEILRNDINALTDYFTSVASAVTASLQLGNFPLIVGGDHSSAIGTWSGVAKYLVNDNKQLGLIWFDAHMDSHTPTTSPSGNIHGMPAATLLGQGYEQFVKIANLYPKILPQNLIFIGIRSFEKGEAELLARLGVKVYYSDEVNERGLAAVFKEAYDKLLNNVDVIGLTIDLDGFDPEDVPGVGTPVENGISYTDFISTLKTIDFKQIAAVEITEGNHHLDTSGKTLNCIAGIIDQVCNKLKS